MSENSAMIIRSNDVYGGLIKSIYDYFHCKSITLIYASSLHSTTSLGLEMETKLMTLNLFLSQKLHIQTTIIDIRNFPLQINNNIEEMTNPLFIILNDLDDIKSLLATTIFTPSASLSLRGTWLIFFKDVTEVKTFCSNFSIPYNLQVLITMKNINEPKGESIIEVYHLGNKLKYQLYGSWNIDTGLIPPKLSLLQRRSNLEGLPLRAAISTILYEPKNSIYSENLIFLEMIQPLSEMMNFTPIMKWELLLGYCTSDTKCTGVMSELVKKNIDICFSPIILSSNRLKYIDMTMNFYSNKLFLYMKKPDQKSRWKEYLRPFEFDVWISIIIVMLLSSIILFLMEMIYNTDDELRSWARLNIKTPNFLNCMFKVFGIICGKETGKSRSTPMRTIQVTIQITSVLIVTSYSAKLIQSLTTGIMVTPPFSSVDDFLNDKTYRLRIPVWSDHLNDFLNSTVIQEQKIIAKILKEKSLPKSEVEGLTQMCHIYKCGFLSYRGILKRYNFPDNCEVLSIGSVLTVHYSMGLQKRSPFREVINYQFYRMHEFGFVQRIINNLKPELTRTRLTNKWIPVQLSHVYPVNIFFIIMIISSLILLYGEIMIDDRMKRTNRILKKAPRQLRKTT
ncbi:glutamate receptor ionotropic, delta-1-like [Chelonus insularis]|uniref:glutamate receptor ionotropic, delta-1-like n=1 Tax=Chelonus insularis TaxID=460826 RepID=UPI00158870DF|nr:glutamate receptor ionotropic, delta-1-like [Chelonus insularis]